MKVFVTVLALCFVIPAYASPFFIPFQPKENVTDADYIQIQKELRKIRIAPLIKQIYPKNGRYALYEDFLSRCSRGINQVLIDTAKGYFPSKQLKKIGKGSDLCVVCCVPIEEGRIKLLRAIPKALQNSGFHGHFYYRIGGFPNPTGREIQFVGVPYCFKIFMMMEAQKLGFNKVLWIDSAALPIRDPTPLFQLMDRTGGVLLQGKSRQNYLLPATQSLLKILTGVDVMKASYISTVIFGLKMDHPKTQKLINDYYQLVEKGTPFLSCFPEEFVLTALIEKFHFPLKRPLLQKIVKSWDGSADSDDKFTRFKNEGYFFYHQRH